MSIFQKQLRNPWVAILLIPLSVFCILMAFQFPSQIISIAARCVAFVLLGLIAGRYVWFAPGLMWAGETSNEAKNVIGWAIVLAALMLQQIYGALFSIVTLAQNGDPPAWLSSTYYGSALVVLFVVGLGVVVWSVQDYYPPGALPRGRGRFRRWRDFFFGMSASAALFWGTHFGPEIGRALAVLFGHAAR